MKNHLKIGTVIIGHTYMPGDFYDSKEKNHDFADAKNRPGVILMFYDDFFLIQWFCSSGKTQIKTQDPNYHYSYDIGNLTCWIHFSKIKITKYINNPDIQKFIQKNYKTILTTIFEKFPRKKKIKKLIQKQVFQNFSKRKQKKWLAIKQFTNTEKTNSLKTMKQCLDKVQYIDQRINTTNPVKKSQLRRKEATQIHDFKQKIFLQSKMKGTPKLWAIKEVIDQNNQEN